MSGEIGCNHKYLYDEGLNLVCNFCGRPAPKPKMPDSKVEVKACPFCEVNLILKEDDHGGIWYEHPDRQPYQIFTYKTNHQKGKECVLSNFTLYPEEIKRWNNRPIANNGVSLEEFRMHVLNVLKNRFPHVGEKSYENIKDAQDEIVAKLQPTAPRGSGEVKHADNCPSVKGAPVCTCEHLRRYS